jgi:hypothetical protein
VCSGRNVDSCWFNQTHYGLLTLFSASRTVQLEQEENFSFSLSSDELFAWYLSMLCWTLRFNPFMTIGPPKESLPSCKSTLIQPAQRVGLSPPWRRVLGPFRPWSRSVFPFFVPALVGPCRPPSVARASASAFVGFFTSISPPFFRAFLLKHFSRLHSGSSSSSINSINSITSPGRFSFATTFLQFEFAEPGCSITPLSTSTHSSLPAKSRNKEQFHQHH